MATRFGRSGRLAAAGVAALAAAAGLTACRGERSDKPPRQFFPDMDDAPKLKPQAETEFFADSRSMRRPVPGTVPFGRLVLAAETAPAEWSGRFAAERAGLLRDDRAFYFGEDADGTYLTRMPVEVTADLIARGRDRFDIYCAACHGYEGDGRGMVGRRWSYAVPSFHDEKYKNPAERTGKDGYLFFTVRNGVPDPATGVNKMPGYGHALTEPDAWAVVAYLRVLQETRSGTIDDAPAAARPILEQARDRARAAAPPPDPAAPPDPSAGSSSGYGGDSGSGAEGAPQR